MKLPDRQRDALLYPDSKHDLRTLKALARKGLVRVGSSSGGRRHWLTPDGTQWVSAYRDAESRRQTADNVSMLGI